MPAKDVSSKRRLLKSLPLALFKVALTLATASAGTPGSPADSSGTKTDHILERWAYFQELALPESASALFDFVLTPAVFDKARIDLGDLRLYDAAGREVPYVLRIRTPVFTDQTVTASEFNRAAGPGGAEEVTLDLGADAPEHNAVEVGLSGVNFRRAAHLEGSADNENWKTLVGRKNLVRFQANGRELDDRRITYPPSRFRYLRLRVSRDPEVGGGGADLGTVNVYHRVEVPGEFVTLPTRLGPREPVNAGPGPGSAWIVDLGADNQPCQKVLANIADLEFARDYKVESAGPVDSEQPFGFVTSGQWRRRAGEAVQPLVAEFSEVTAAQLRLVVTDYRNPPLELKSVDFAAPARQIVFSRDESSQGPLRLYYGNPNAEPPHYDMERNLPAQLEPPPERLAVGLQQKNPEYIPAPLPLTERLPWLIYVVLGAASFVLALIILSLGRTALAMHDARGNTDAATSS
jgi:Protein of unknown function (DUF3999)